MNEQLTVCHLTAKGMEVARGHLESLRTGGLMPTLERLLTDARYARPVQTGVRVEQRAFADRRQAGKYLAEQLEPLSADFLENPYLWSWLGMFYLEQVSGGAERRASAYTEIAHLIDPSRHDSRDRAHHRLKLAHDIWTVHGEGAWLLLNDKVGSMSQFTLRLAQTGEVFRSRGIVRLAHLLYADNATRRVKAGALGSDQTSAPAGSLPRLIRVLTQLSMTYDVYGMEAEQLLSLLPQEFDGFRPRYAAVER